MAVWNKFYENKSDPQLLKDILGKGMFWYLRKLVADDFNARYDVVIAPPFAFVTMRFPSPTAGIGTNELIGGLIAITNNNGQGRYFTITGNFGMDIIGQNAKINALFNQSLCESDESFTFTNLAYYDIKVWSLERFIGYTELAQLTDIPEYKDYIVNVPEKKLKKGLIRRFPNVQMSMRTTGLSIYEAMLGAVDVNPSSVNRYYLRVGSNSPASGRYYVHGREQVDQGGKAREIVLFNTELIPNGATDIETDADTWVKVPLFIDILAEPRNGDTENYYELRYEK